MNIEDVRKEYTPERRSIRINMRITRSQDRFTQENNLSFTKIFDQALKQLGYKEPSIQDLKKEEHSLKDSYRENKDRKYRTSRTSKLSNTSKRPTRRKY